jgi:hypothetical protein
VPDTTQPDTTQPDTTQPDTTQPDACTLADPPWWNGSYASRFPLNVGAAPADYTIEIALSGADASSVYSAAALASGDDLRIVHHDGSPAEIDREILQFTSGSVVVRFMIQEPGGWGGGSGTYYLYVGNSSPAAPLADLHNVYIFFDDFQSTTPGQAPSGWRLDPAGDWDVVDEGGDHVLQCIGSGRHIAEIVGFTEEDIGIGVSMRLDAANGSNNNGIFFRGTQSNPTSSLYLWYAQLREANDQAQIGEYNVDKAQSWSTTLTVSTGNWYDIEARVVGSSMDMWVDGVSRVSNPIGESGPQSGLFAYNPELVYDDVKVRLLSDPEPGVTLGAIEQPCS